MNYLAGRFEEIAPCRWRLGRDADRAMAADAEVFATRDILQQALADDSIAQVVNVACLPGLVGRSLAMPDIHHGYGFCIGGVAAFPAADGIVLPGGVGYDINCGVRLLSSSIPAADFAAAAEGVGHAILQRIPTGLTQRSLYRLGRKEFQRVLAGGVGEIVRNFGGDAGDREFIESGGCLPFDSPAIISPKACQRGSSQLGSLGSGNHFIEVQAVEEVFDAPAARLFGLQPDHVVVMIHTGSRGFGHQVASDYIETFRKRNLGRQKLRDPQLVHAAVGSAEGRNYLQALNAASNFAWANRQLLQEEVVDILEKALSMGRERLGLRLLYDQAHNIAKFETHEVEGRKVELLVHRKGATRAFPPGHPDLASPYRAVGQPVIIPGSMGSSSYVLRGTARAAALTFASSAHGAGRRLSRHQAVKAAAREDVSQRLRNKGILVFSLSSQGLKEEIPEAYKDIDDVVTATVAAGISERVARLRPLLVVKG
ncbi:MAG: RtcB family protein [Candidatus Aminicenantes bacterium]|nr:RtcB family protein [Candidatus Aminicenantes bacterium]